MLMNQDDKTYKYLVESARGLWEPVTLTVKKGVIIHSSVKRGYEIGAKWESMRKYFEQGEGENEYKITELHESDPE